MTEQNNGVETDQVQTADADETQAAEQTPKRPRRWPWITGIFAAFLVGLGIGAAGQPEPEVVTETRTVEVEVEPADLAEQRAEVEQRAVEQAQRDQELADLEAELDEIHADLEAEVEAIEQNTITDGVWVVGVDIEPGTYRAAGVSSDCYWAILRTGTNGDDIINNGIPGGGNPQVTLSEGQDFESSRCGEWIKQ